MYNTVHYRVYKYINSKIVLKKYALFGVNIFCLKIFSCIKITFFKSGSWRYIVKYRVYKVCKLAEIYCTIHDVLSV